MVGAAMLAASISKLTLANVADCLHYRGAEEARHSGVCINMTYFGSSRKNILKIEICPHRKPRKSWNISFFKLRYSLFTRQQYKAK